MSTRSPERPDTRRPIARILESPSGRPTPRRPDDVAAPVSLHRFESLAVFLISWAAFFAIGYHAVINQHIVPADAVDLMGRAYYVWHNDPAKLAAIGFNAPPLQTIGLMPFAILKPLASSLVALPLASGFWAALALVLIHRTLARCGFGTPRRFATTLLVACNPLWLFYATTGMPDMIYLAALAASLYFIFTWVIEDQPRFVAGAGLCLALLAMSRFGFIIWAVIVAIVVAITLAARNANEDESEGLLITLLAPLAAIVCIWMLVCLLIAGQPFDWIVNAQPFGGTSNSEGSHSVDLGSLLKYTGALLVGGSLITVLAFLGLVGAAFNKDRVAGALIFIILGGIGVMVGNAVIHDDLSLLSLRSALPLTVFGIGATAWLAHSRGGVANVMGLVSLAIAIPAAGIAMDRYPYQNLEQSFIRGLIYQQDQEGQSSRGGYEVGIRDEQRMSAFIKDLVGTRRNAVLADNSLVGGVILLTGRPQIFVDRVDYGDESWLKTLRNPWGKVRYMLTIEGTQNGTNTINVTYPSATAGKVPGLEPVFKSGRYVLLSVSTVDPKVAARRAEQQLTNSETTP